MYPRSASVLCPAVVLSLGLPAGPVAAQQLNTVNPINATIPTSSLSAELVDVIQIPRSANNSQPRLGFLTHVPDGSGRLVVSDQRGRLWGFTPGDQDAALVLNTNGMPGFVDGFEQGLRGFAFHPDFASPGSAGENKVYVAYSANNGSGTPDYPSPNGFGTDHHSVVAEFTVDPNTMAVSNGSRREIIRVAQPFSNHNIGQLAFNPVASDDPDYGNLYIGMGDGGAGNDPINAGQRLDTPLGSIMRIDPTPSGPGEYDIPAGNLVTGVNQAPEIFLFGARNPHRFAWDPVAQGGDGRMFFSDIGQDSVEEINVGRNGLNYGWDQREGTFVNSSSGGIFHLFAGHPTDGVEYPVAQYDHDFNNNNVKEDGVAVVGGFVYHDDALPDLQGKYFFGDFAGQSSGPIFIVDSTDLVERDDFTNLSSLSNGFLSPYEELRLTHNGVPISSFEALLRQTSGNGGLSRSDLRFGTDADGAIWILNKHDGQVRKLLPGVRADTDFDFSGFSDAADADRLLDAFGGVTNNTEIFNLDDTGPSANQVDGNDFLTWLALVGSTVGDANLSGQVEQGDLDAVLQNWGSTTAGYATGDLNNSGQVEQGDLDMVLQNWGDTAAPDFGGSDVPEPIGFATAAVGFWLLGTRRTGHR